jgi:hypothetical protein
MALTVGARLGPYEILAPLGAGGMGEVFRARDTKLSREVALKVLPDHLRDDPKALARFESEARAVAALSHPHILAIHDFGRIDGTSFAVAELLEGETLRALLLRGPVPVRRALEIARPSPTPSPPPTQGASSTATSSPRTSSSPATATSSSSTSASPTTPSRPLARGDPLPHRPRPHRRRRRPRHRRLHVPRAGPRPPRRPPLRPVLPRRPPLRDARGPPPLPRRLRRGDPHRHHPRGARAALDRDRRRSRSGPLLVAASSPRTPRGASTPPATSRRRSRRAPRTSRRGASRPRRPDPRPPSRRAGIALSPPASSPRPSLPPSSRQPS